MKLSKVTAELLDYIQKGVLSSPHTVVRTVNALGSGPLAYRTFGGNVQNYAAIDEQALEKAFGSHYLLTMIAQGLIIRRILYPESGSCHTLYCDKAIYGFFARHGLLDCGVWSHVDYETLERNITPENTDYRIYYSYSKPDALLKEAELAGEQVPVFFVDTDLILKKRHDVIIPGAASVKAAYSHLEQIGGECYPPFASLHFPEESSPKTKSVRAGLFTVNRFTGYHFKFGLSQHCSIINIGGFSLLEAGHSGFRRIRSSLKQRVSLAAFGRIGVHKPFLIGFVHVNLPIRRFMNTPRTNRRLHRIQPNPAYPCVFP